MSIIQFIKSKAFWKHFMFICIAFVALLAIAFMFLKFYTRHGQHYDMPKIENMFVDELEDYEPMKNFELVITDSVFTQGEAAGKIISQDPVEGSVVKKGRKVYVVVTSNVGEYIPVPNCTDLSLSSAVSQLCASGLRIRKFIFREGDFNNIVIAQQYKDRNLEGGEKMQRGEAIDLVVEMDKDHYTTSMPNIIGMTEQDAERKLWDYGLIMGKKTYEGKKEAANSRVISFSPNYASTTKGSTVNVKFLNDKKSNYKKKVKEFKKAEEVIEIDSTDIMIENAIQELL